MNTPLGDLCILADNPFNLRAVEWQEHRWRLDKLLHIHYGKNNIQLTAAVNPDGLSDAFHAYFTGNLDALNAQPTATPGTPFQQQVWQALRTIPCAEGLYYGQLAALLGRPTAARAVGAANGVNPLSIVVPYHRVIGVMAR